MKKRIILLPIILLLFNAVIGQNANDDCSNAFNIGNLPGAAGCSGPNTGQGTDVVTNLTTIGATTEFPYPAIIDCQGTNVDMANPAADTWATFVASANELDITITSSMSGVSVGVYQGSNCGSLTPAYCAVSNNGNLSETFSSITPGEQYFIQISGDDETDVSDLTLTLNNNNDCNQCAQDISLAVNPLPVNGVYQPGTTVEFCLTIGSFEEISTNWLHGIVPKDLGSGWDANSLTGTGVSGSNTTWHWTDNNVPDLGYWVDYNAGAVNPSNNYGDDNASNVTACFEITTVDPADCVNGASAAVLFDTYADGETGSWTNLACEQDPVTPFASIVSCCDFPIMTFTDPPCSNLSGGTASATGQGGTAPYDYDWENSAGTNILSENNLADGVASNLTGLTAGTYTVTVTDDNGCEKIMDVTLTAPVSTLVVDAGPDVVTCATAAGGSVPVVIGGAPTASGSSGYNYAWTPTTNLTSSSVANPSASPSSNTTYTVTVTDGDGCEASDDVLVTITPFVAPTFNAVADVCIGAAAPVLPTSSTNAPAITGTWSPAVSTAAAGTITYTFTPTAGQCSEPTTLDITVTPLIVPTFAAVAAVCQNATAPVLPTSSTNATPITGSWSPAVSTATTGPTTYTFTPDAGQCADQATLDITIYTLPVPVASSDSIVCFGDNDGSVTVTGITNSPGTFPGQYSYSWAPSGQTTQTTTSTLGVGVYTVTVQDLTTTCTATTTAEVFTPPVLATTITPTPPACAGGTGSAIANPTGGTGAYTYSWDTSPVQTTQTATVLTPGVTYTVTVQDHNGCETTETVNLADGTVITAAFNIPDSAQCFDVNSYVLTNGGTPGVSYDWNFGDAGTSTTESPTHAYTTAGTFTITQIVYQGTCADTIQQ